MVEITPLFTAAPEAPQRAPAAPLSPAPAGAPQAAQEALGAALLIGILTDLSALKEAMAGQVRMNAAIGEWVTAQQTINAGLIARLEALEMQVRDLAARRDPPAAVH